MCCVEIGGQAIAKIQPGFDLEDKFIYNHLATLSGLSMQTLADYGQAQSTICQFCQAPAQDLLHLLWACPCLEHRCRYGMGKDNFDPSIVPFCVFMGIPMAMGLCSQEAFWGAAYQQVVENADILGHFHSGKAFLLATRDKLQNLANSFPTLKARQILQISTISSLADQYRIRNHAHNSFQLYQIASMTVVSYHPKTKDGALEAMGCEMWVEVVIHRSAHMRCRTARPPSKASTRNSGELSRVFFARQAELSFSQPLWH